MNRERTMAISVLLLWVYVIFSKIEPPGYVRAEWAHGWIGMAFTLIMTGCAIWVIAEWVWNEVHHLRVEKLTDKEKETT